MAWIKVEQSLYTHRKTFELADRLEMPEMYAAAHLIALWQWALDNAPDGQLPQSDRQIAKGAQWDGPATHFVEALVFAGFVDDDYMGNRSLHDWDAWAGALIRKRKANADRQKKYQGKQKHSSDFMPDEAEYDER